MSIQRGNAEFLQALNDAKSLQTLAESEVAAIVRLVAACKLAQTEFEFGFDGNEETARVSVYFPNPADTIVTSWVPLASATGDAGRFADVVDGVVARVANNEDAIRRFSEWFRFREQGGDD